MSDQYDQINLIGIEIEGRWKERPKYGLRSNKSYINEEGEETRKGLMYDGSITFYRSNGDPINVNGRLGRRVEQQQPNIGEAVSDPLPPKRAIKWLRQVYPDKVNQSCGLHVHMSFVPNKYQLLMDMEFWRFFKRQAVRWGENHKVPDRYWDRLQGNNDTCRAKWDPDQQVHGDHDTRYRVWNFHAFRSHGTAECRLMPAFKSTDLAVQSVQFICQSVQEYLKGLKPEPLLLKHNPDKATETQTKSF